jgi:hypothetical protein
MNERLFYKQFVLVERMFPKLKYSWSTSIKSFLISGDLDICDVYGNYWDTFNICLVVGDAFPYSVPILVERSKKIPRLESRHISEEGICCMDMEHKLLKRARRGLNIAEFIKEQVYPYFANQLYYQKEKKFANSEWDHNFKGVVQFYAEELGLTDPELIVMFLTKLLSKSLPERNAPCVCKVVKYKKCKHYDSMNFLSDLPRARLEKDLEEFQSLTSCS